MPMQPDASAALKEQLEEEGKLWKQNPQRLREVLAEGAERAKIPTITPHALRHTFGTLLSKAGVAPRTAQAAMRHSTLDLTMNVYTDPRLLDVQGAVEALPSLPLNSSSQTARAAVGEGAVGPVDGPRLALRLALQADNSGQSQSIPGKEGGSALEVLEAAPVAVTSTPDKRKGLPRSA